MKDYKEILEGVMNIINTTEKSDIGFVNICTYISENCPELKESEDERIRKALIELVRMVDKNPIHQIFGYGDIKYSDMIAWLERQGEHSVSSLFTFEDVLTIQCAMAYAKFQDRELDVALKKLHDKVYDAYHDSKNHNIESQDGLKGEQILDNSAKTCKDEQKPDWSEDDEKMIEAALQFAHEYGRHGLWCWLKSLKDRVQPQNTWKPSDEMLEALDIAIRAGIQLGSWEERALRELQKQLIEL